MVAAHKHPTCDALKKKLVLEACILTLVLQNAQLQAYDLLDQNQDFVTHSG